MVTGEAMIQAGKMGFQKLILLITLTEIKSLHTRGVSDPWQYATTLEDSWTVRATENEEI